MGIYRSKLSSEKQLEIIECFSENLPARKAASKLAVEINTAAEHYRKIRSAIHEVRKGVQDKHLGKDAKLEIQRKDVLLDHISAQRFAASRPVLGMVLGITPDRDYNDPENEIFWLPWLGDPNRGDRVVTSHKVIFEGVKRETTRTSVHRWFSLWDCEPNEERAWKTVLNVMKKYNSVERTELELYLKECEFKFKHPSFKSRTKILRGWFGL